MTACDYYEIFVGNIGISRHEFLYDIRYWEARRIYNGFMRRNRDMWSATRWQTFNIMCALVGGKALSSKGINSPRDLLKFDWDREDLDDDTQLPTDEEIEKLRQRMREENAKIDKG